MGPSYDRFRALTSQLKTNFSKSWIPSALGEFEHSSNNVNEFISERKRKPNVNSNNNSNVAASSAHGYHLAISDESNCLGNERNAGALRSTRRNTAYRGANLVGGLGTLTDEGKTKLNAMGVPLDHPLNREGYRYILVEPDIHAMGRQLWDDCEYTAGKPIPGLFYRVCNPSHITLSFNDRATHLKLSDNQLSMTGEKGYGSARCSHSTHIGTWYFECTIIDQPEGSHARIGWAQSYANLQAPIGYDKFGYSWRSRLGTAFHLAKGKHYADKGYSKGDTIGCMIILPARPKNETNGSTSNGSRQNGSASAVASNPDGPTSAKASNLDGVSLNKQKSYSMWNHLPDTFKDRPLIKFRNYFYFEEKDEPEKAEEYLKPLPGSEIRFYRNGEPIGVAYKDIYMGSYFPAVSLYRQITVQTNFGPDFKYPPTDVENFKPMSDRLLETDVEQCLADVIDLVDKDGLVEELINNCISSVY